MDKIIFNKWRPFVKLTCLETLENGTRLAHPFYFDVNCRVVMIEDDENGYTILHIKDVGSYIIKETPDEIIKLVDSLIEKEQDRLAEEAKKNYEATMSRVEEFKKNNLE